MAEEVKAKKEATAGSSDPKRRPQAAKRNLQAKRRQLRAKQRKTKIKTAFKGKSLSEVFSLLDKARKTGLFTKNKIDRLKSKFAKKLHA